MADDKTASASVVVRVDPDTAFRVFTEEMTDWWVPGPINFYDSSRAVGMRCESGVGGRLIEVYDPVTGDGLELGRIAEWVPGSRLKWQSSVDDVELTVSFNAEAEGTRVVVEARIPATGRDEGGTAWVRVAPAWFAAWCYVREQQVRGPVGLSRLGLMILYEDPSSAARWLQRVIGLEPTLPLPEDTQPTQARNDDWIEFRVGRGLLVVSKRDSGDAAHSSTHIPWIFVENLDEHYQAAQSARVKVIKGIHQHGYRAYTVEDPEGFEWTIAQALPSMNGELVASSV